jgi:hypothetical protein
MNHDMNRLDPGFDPRIADWLESDPDQAPREILDTVLAAMPSIPQRRPIWLPRRFPELLTPTRAAVAAVLGVLLVGGVLLIYQRPSPDDVGGAAPSPSPSVSAPPTAPTPSPTASSTPTLVPGITAGYVGITLRPDTYRVAYFAAPFTVTFPTGWVVGEVTPNNVVFHNGNAFLTLVVMNKVYRDPCHTEKAPTAIGPGVDDLVGALLAMKGFQTSDIKDVTVGGAAGKSFTLSNSIDLRAAHCSRSDVLVIGTNDNNGVDVPVLETADGADALWVVDASGTTVLMGGPQELIDTISFGG